MDTSTKLTTNNLQSSSFLAPLSSSAGLQDSISSNLSARASSIGKTLIVNSTSDTVNDSDGVTTLREAINTANTDASEDSIIFDSSIFSTGQKITLNLGELDITHSLNIFAPVDFNTGQQLVTISGNNNSRVFEITGGVDVSLSGLIITDGRAANDNGGGIKNSGNLTLSNSIVRNNSAGNVGGGGGGIWSNGATTVSNSSISNNESNGNVFSNGGGIYISNGALTLSNSTVSSNSASDGSDIFNDSGIITVSNSSLSSV
ncbi:hypothetical protein NIES4071_02040 [Calothrix sp. NIES-4071]|nr:hypothetical protein NIES4071_02040 [Calothrix sp. NIES-4071]BAZ54550.1 hypothetical protein NIES4105_02030 [Calothrix sp. NIES-4105]